MGKKHMVFGVIYLVGMLSGVVISRLGEQIPNLKKMMKEYHQINMLAKPIKEGYKSKMDSLTNNYIIKLNQLEKQVKEGENIK